MAYSCDLCGLSFGDKNDDLRRHRYEHHTCPDPVIVLGKVTSIMRLGNNLLGCPVPGCPSQSLVTRSSFKKHLTNQHKDKVGFILSPTGSSKCSSKRPRGPSTSISEGPPSSKKGKTKGFTGNGTPAFEFAPSRSRVLCPCQPLNRFFFARRRCQTLLRLLTGIQIHQIQVC